MMSRPVVVSPVKAILAMRLRRRQRLAGLEPKPLTMFRTPGRQQVRHHLGPEHDRRGRLLGGLEHHAVAGGQRGASFQVAIRSGKFHGNDLPTTPSGSWKW
jgi:hypothetical protein